jgi:hypothetical protein
MLFRKIYKLIVGNRIVTFTAGNSHDFLNRVGVKIIFYLNSPYFKKMVTESKLSMNILKIQSFYTKNNTYQLSWFQKIKTCSDCDTNKNDFKLTLSSLQILQEIIISA